MLKSVLVLGFTSVAADLSDFKTWKDTYLQSRKMRKDYIEVFTVQPTDLVVNISAIKF